jgi:hypothetical protein
MMMLNPRVGQRVQVWYGQALRAVVPYHGRPAVVVVAGRGRPRNHLVRLDDGTTVVVPCGNLRAARGGGEVRSQSCR